MAAGIKLATLMLVNWSIFRAIATMSSEPTQFISLITGVRQVPATALAERVSKDS